MVYSSLYSLRLAHSLGLSLGLRVPRALSRPAVVEDVLPRHVVALRTEQVAGARPRLAGCTDQQRLQRGVALDQLELERVAYMKEPLGSPRVTSGNVELDAGCRGRPSSKAQSPNSCRRWILDGRK